MMFMDWWKAICGGYLPNHTDEVNRQRRHCRIGRVKPVDGLMLII